MVAVAESNLESNKPVAMILKPDVHWRSLITVTKWAVPETRSTPSPRWPAYVYLQIWEFASLYFVFNKMGTPKLVNFPVFVSKTAKKFKLTFVVRMIKILGNSHVFLTLATESVITFLGIPKWNMWVKFFLGFLFFSFNRGVRLTYGIAQYIS